MNYTEKYHLPQWVKTDRIMMDDFNAAMTGIESGMSEAKETADAAKRGADAAYTPDRKPYVVGTYEGNGGIVKVKLGFRPSFLIICGTQETYATSSSALSFYNLFTNGANCPNAVQFTDTGFTAKALENGYYPQTTNNGRTYCYIAFR